MCPLLLPAVTRQCGPLNLLGGICWDLLGPRAPARGGASRHQGQEPFVTPIAHYVSRSPPPPPPGAGRQHLVTPMVPREHCWVLPHHHHLSGPAPLTPTPHSNTAGFAYLPLLTAPCMHRFLADTLPSFDTVVANLGLHHSGTPTLRTEIDLLVSLFPSPEMKGRLIYRTTFPRSVWARGREAGN